MVFEQGLYVHSPFSQKLNRRKYDYATLAECFDIADDLTKWNEKSRGMIVESDYSRKTDRRRANRDTPPPSP